MHLEHNYNPKYILIYSKINAIITTFLAINSDLDVAATRSSLHLIALLLLRHRGPNVDSNILNMCDLEPDI